MPRTDNTPAVGGFGPAFGDQVRLSWTIAGTTPSFRFAVDWTSQ